MIAGEVAEARAFSFIDTSVAVVGILMESGDRQPKSTSLRWASGTTSSLG